MLQVAAMDLAMQQAGPALGAAFLGSLVEAVEAFTVVLAAATMRGWRPAVLGAAAGLVALAAIVAVLGPLLGLVPLHVLQLAIGVLLLLFGLRWLRKAILRAAGVVALHDEIAAFARTSSGLEDAALRDRALGWLAGVTAFKAVLLEGVEVVFIVLAVGAGRGLLLPASLGALAACLLVLAIGAALRRPLARVPENTLKFAVGAMLSAFGVYWTGEGLGLSWPGGDAALLGLAASFLLAGLVLVSLARRAAEARHA